MPMGISAILNIIICTLFPFLLGFTVLTAFLTSSGNFLSIINLISDTLIVVYILISNNYNYL